MAGRARRFVVFDAGVIAVPTAGVVLATRFIPNCAVPIVLVVADDIAAIVLLPDVSVGPLSVIE